MLLTKSPPRDFHKTVRARIIPNAVMMMKTRPGQIEVNITKAGRLWRANFTNVVNVSTAHMVADHVFPLADPRCRRLLVSVDGAITALYAFDTVNIAASQYSGSASNTIYWAE